MPNEPQNSSTSKRVLLPLEPDFSHIIDPSIVIAPPSNTWASDYRHTSPRHSRRDLSKDKHKTKKRRRHRSSSSSSSRFSSASHKRSKRSKRSKHSHKRRRRHSTSSSSSSNHSIHDYGRYKRTRVSLQVAEVPSTLQPVRFIDQTPIIHLDNVVQQTRDSGSESDLETWSFDRAINEVFRLLPQDLFPNPTEEHTPTKPLSGTEHLMENHASPLMTLPQSKLVENTTKFIQSKIESVSLTKDWLCPHHLISSLAPTKYYKSQNQYLPTKNLPLLEPDASLLDIPTRGRCSVPVKNLEFWEKSARKLMAINSCADLFSSAA